MKRTFGTLILCAVTVCTSVDAFEQMRAGTYDRIFQGTYRGSARYTRDTGAFASMIANLRQRIEANADVLPHIVHRFFPTSDELIFRYKFTAHDAEKEYLILRYFARIPEHQLYAGYQIQFVFQIPAEKLVDVYTAEVPLE